MTDPAPTVRRILDATACHFALSRRDLVSQRRDRQVIRPRQIAMWLARRLTPKSLPEIGRHIGGRDHSTVAHGIAVVDRLMATSPTIRDAVAAVSEELRHPMRTVDERERDPLVVAIELVTGARHPTDVSVDEIGGMAGALVGYGRTIGAVVVDGETSPDPERLPIEVEVRVAPPGVERLLAAVDRLLAARAAHEDARYSTRERSAGEALLNAFRSLEEARSNMEP